jgi:HEAT repeat protein
MNPFFRAASLPLAVFLVGGHFTAGCSKPASPPTPPAKQPAADSAKPPQPPVVAPEAKPKPATEAVPEPKPEPKPEPASEPKPPEPKPTDASAAKAGDSVAEMAALIETLTTTDDSRTRVITIDAIATELRGGLPALDALVKALADEEPRVRWHAARAIGLIGHEAAPAIGNLVKLLDDSDPVTVTQAAAAIGHIREDDERGEIPAADREAYGAAVDPLVNTLTHPDPRARRAAVRALRHLATSREDLLAAVRKQLADADPVAVLPALHTLADMEEDAVPFLIEALSDPKSRYWAEVVLAEIGPEAAAAVEPLAKVAADAPIEERVQAILALAAIGEPATTATPQFVAALESPDASLRYVAAYALGKLRAKDADAALEKATASDDQFLAALASWARARIHPDDEALCAKAVERLEVELVDESPALRQAAIEGLSGLADSMDEAGRGEFAERLVGSLADPVPSVGLAAGGALIRLGRDAVGALTKALAVPETRNAAMELLAEIGADAQPALEAMVAGLSDEDPGYRSNAAMAIAALGPRAKGAVPALEKMLGDEAAVPESRYTAAYALGSIGPEAVAAEPLLRKLAESEDELMATVGVWAALKIKPDDATLFDAAIPKLRHALQREQELVRLEAAVALGEIGPRAATALPMLEMLAEEDPSKTVRAAAAEAVRRIKASE